MSKTSPVALSQPALHQTVSIAVEVKGSPAAKRNSGLRRALRVELDELEPVSRGESEEGNIVGFVHGMIQGDETLILHRLDSGAVSLVRLLSLQRRVILLDEAR